MVACGFVVTGNPKSNKARACADMIRHSRILGVVCLVHDITTLFEKTADLFRDNNLNFISPE